MNCKQGDMAMVVGSKVGNNSGKVVTCLSLVRGPILIELKDFTLVVDDAEWFWLVDRKMDFYDIENGKTYYELSPYMPDRALMPINGTPEEVKDETHANLV